MFKHSYCLCPRKSGSGGTVSFSVLLTVNKQRKNIPLGISCKTHLFNAGTKMIKDKALNLRLYSLLGDLDRILMQGDVADIPPTLAQVVEQFQRVIGGGGNPINASFREAFDDFIKSECTRLGWSPQTLRRNRTNLACALNYAPHLRMVDITASWYAEYYAYLLQQYKASTLQRKVGDFRRIITWCQKHGYYNGDALDYEPTVIGASNVNEPFYLTVDEVRSIEQHKWTASQQALERVADCFVFCCYTGLRHSDLKQLEPFMIYDDGIHLTTEKTHVPVSIPLNDHSRRILQKYDYKLPVISNQKGNDAIKVVARICGIDAPYTETYFKGGTRHTHTAPKHEVITWHDSRRTFVTLAATLGIDANVIIKFTGHASTQQLRPYLAIAEKLKQDNMSRFNNI